MSVLLLLLLRLMLSMVVSVMNILVMTGYIVRESGVMASVCVCGPNLSMLRRRLR